jgi:sugar phosphate isomerase/epimerase
VEEWYQPYLPDAVWGNGKLSEISGRAAEEMVNTFRVAEQLGAQLVSGFTGSPIWGAVSGYPSLPVQRIRDAFAQFADRWNPILDVAGDLGVRFACEIHPGQLAFDLYSAELILEAVDHRPEFGFTFDPSHLHWLGVDPVEFLRKFPDRIFHVHIKDATLSLDGRSSVLTGYWPSGDPRRGWQFRSPGRGGIDWDAILRTLYQIGYSGIFSVDWHDPDLDRDFGAQDAAEFLQRLVFEPRRPLPR